MELPAPYSGRTVDGATVVAAPSALDAVCAVVEEAGSLSAYAAACGDAGALAGRGTAHRIPAPAGADGVVGEWLVRHYRRGGVVAGPLLGDRYLRLGEPRPVHELRVSDAARVRGVPTPEVVAAVVYPAGPFYRGDLATAFVPDSLTLAELLFGKAAADESKREQGCAAAGALIRQAHDAGLVHGDLNLRNVLLQRTEAGFAAHLLDLDGAALVDRAGGVSGLGRRRMLARFWRSARKFEAATGRRLDARERRAFEAAYGETK